MVKKIVAFIPLRGGSKSIPLKNIKEIAGKPLAYWTISAALNCKLVDEVVVATDSDLIKDKLSFIKSDKLYFYDRIKENAQDTSSTESAMLEYFEKNNCEDVVLIQATSPLLTSEDLTKGIEKYKNENFDSLLSLVRIKRFFWEQFGGGVRAVNYDFTSRPRRQEFEGQLVENGAFYISSRDSLLKSKCRLSGKIGYYEMKEESFYEIDEPQDWLIVSNLIKSQTVNSEFNNKLKKIKLFLTDVDGCLTDGGMYYSENGDELKKFNTRDGKAFELLKEAGLKVGIITSEDRQLNKTRAIKLNLDYHFHGVKNKIEALDKIISDLKIDYSEVLYIGDDLNDLETLKKVGFSVAPLDANQQILEIVDFVSHQKGGSGVIREIADILLVEMEAP